MAVLGCAGLCRALLGCRGCAQLGRGAAAWRAAGVGAAGVPLQEHGSGKASLGQLWRVCSPQHYHPGPPLAAEHQKYRSLRKSPGAAVPPPSVILSESWI